MVDGDFNKITNNLTKNILNDFSNSDLLNYYFKNIENLERKIYIALHKKIFSGINHQIYLMHWVEKSVFKHDLIIILIPLQFGCKDVWNQSSIRVNFILNYTTYFISLIIKISYRLAIKIYSKIYNKFINIFKNSVSSLNVNSVSTIILKNRIFSKYFFFHTIQFLRVWDMLKIIFIQITKIQIFIHLILCI